MYATLCVVPALIYKLVSVLLNDIDAKNRSIFFEIQGKTVSRYLLVVLMLPVKHQKHTLLKHSYIYTLTCKHLFYLVLVSCKVI